MGKLENKVAIVTGAGQGIGRAIAVAFADEGAKVVVVCRTIKNGEETVRMIKDVGGEAKFIKTDVSKTEAIKNMVKSTADTYGGIDILVNNAAVNKDKYVPTIEWTENDFKKIMNINVGGVWLGMKYTIPEMIKRGRGAIINISSTAADAAQLGSCLYAASKSAVVMLSRVAAAEYGCQKIRVNTIKPGVVYTPMLMNFMTSPELTKFMESKIPLGYIGDPEQIACAAVFLASDDASYITGHELIVDGGMGTDSHLAFSGEMSG